MIVVRNFALFPPQRCELFASTDLLISFEMHFRVMILWRQNVVLQRAQRPGLILCDVLSFGRFGSLVISY